MSANEFDKRLSQADERLSDLEKDFAVVKYQLNRIVDDIESEKGTRIKANNSIKELLDSIVARQDRNFDGINERHYAVERRVNIGIGILIALQITIPLLLQLFSHGK